MKKLIPCEAMEYAGWDSFDNYGHSIYYYSSAKPNCQISFSTFADDKIISAEQKVFKGSYSVSYLKAIELTKKDLEAISFTCDQSGFEYDESLTLEELGYFNDLYFSNRDRMIFVQKLVEGIVSYISFTRSGITFYYKEEGDERILSDDVSPDLFFAAYKKWKDWFLVGSR